MDFAVTSGMRSACLAESAVDGGAAAIAYEGKQGDYLGTKASCEVEGIAFIPMVVDAAGGWAPAARMVLTELATFSARASGDSVSSTTTRVLQRLGVVLQRENARAILRRGETPAEDSLVCDAFAG